VRKIEKLMIAQLDNYRSFNPDIRFRGLPKSANTQIVVLSQYRYIIKLHGNTIAQLGNGILTINEATLKRWPTRTTKSRIRALMQAYVCSNPEILDKMKGEL
jgi:hypothetical protein